MNHHDRNRYQDDPAYRGGYTMGRRSDIMGAFSDAVRDNPMSAALIGMGALWLFMGGNRMSLLGGNGRTSLVGSVAHGAGDVAQGTAHAASQMGSSVASTVSSTVSGIAETVSDAASRMGSYVSGAVGGVDAQSEYRNSSVSEGRSDDDYGMDDEDEYSSGRGYMASVTSLRGSMQDLFERHPMALGVAGLAIGAGVAASLPLTSTERETLGKAGDAVREKVADVAEQAKDMAKTMADEVRQQTGA